MANTWNKAGTTWGYNSWESDTVTVSLTGVSATTTLGTAVAYPEQGWGRDTWGSENWGESAITVSLTGLSLTSTLGSPTPGWGDLSWGTSVHGWGYPIIPQQQMGLTGVSVTYSVGSLVVGIGVPLTGVSATGSTGSITVSTLTTVELTGVSATITLGTVSPIHYKADTITGYTAYSVETLTA